jgi:hypothetical protein
VTIVVAPAVILVILILWPFSMLLSRPRRRTAEEAAACVRAFIEGTGADDAWDDFTTFAIADPRLESIRARAAEVDLPASEEGLKTLRALLKEAELIARADITVQ